MKTKIGFYRLLVIVLFTLLLLNCSGTPTQQVNAYTSVDYTSCVATYVTIPTSNVAINSTLFDSFEFVVTYNEGCPLPEKSCTYIDGGPDGGPSCIRIQ